MATREELERACREHCERGGSTDELIASLHKQGVSFMDTLKLLRNACGMDLGDAKAAVMAHPSWAAESAKANQLHDEIEKALSKEKKPE